MGCFKFTHLILPLAAAFLWLRTKQADLCLTLGTNIKMDTAPFSQAVSAGKFSEVRYP